jgi:hypothetical protein
MAAAHHDFAVWISQSGFRSLDFAVWISQSVTFLRLLGVPAALGGIRFGRAENSGPHQVHHQSAAEPIK